MISPGLKYFYENYCLVNGQRPVLTDRDRFEFDRIEELYEAGDFDRVILKGIRYTKTLF